MTIIEKIFQIFPEATDEQRHLISRLFRKQVLKIDPKTKPNPDGNEWEKRLAIFDKSRKAYPGTKGGVVVEFNHLLKTVGEDEIDVVLKKIPFAIAYQKAAKDLLKQTGEFVPSWKNMSTWLNNRCWDDEISGLSRSAWYKSLTSYQIGTIQ